MKYQEGDILYYVNPFVFEIDKVKIEMALNENGELFYIDDVGAYLKEYDLFRNLEEAKIEALTRLNKFYREVQTKITKTSDKDLL